MMQSLDRSRLLRTLAVSCLSFLVIVGVAEAATTLSANVVTDGNMTVSGNSTLGDAVTDDVTLNATIVAGSDLTITVGDVAVGPSMVIDTDLDVTTFYGVVDMQDALSVSTAEFGGDLSGSNWAIDAFGVVTLGNTVTMTDLLTVSGGVTSTAGEVLVSGGNVQLNDNVVLSVGSGDDMTIAHDGVNSEITNVTGDLTITSDTLTIDANSGVTLTTGPTFDFIITSNDWSVDATGSVVVGGDLSVSSTSLFSGAVTMDAGFTNTASEALFSAGNVQLNDNVVLTVGTGDDMTIAHDGVNSEITNVTGALNITSGEISIATNGGGNDTINIVGTAASDLITIGSGTEQVEITDDQWSILENGTGSFSSVSTGGLTIDGGTQIIGHLSDAETADFGVIAVNDCDELTFTVTGAAVGDVVAVGLDPDMLTGNETTYTAYVSALNTVTLRACNVSAGAATADLPVGDIRLDVWKH
jgi:hypothetical protein